MLPCSSNQDTSEEAEVTAVDITEIRPAAELFVDTAEKLLLQTPEKSSYT